MRDMRYGPAHLRRPASRRRPDGAAGFNLLELLLIVAIVGILAVMAIETLSTYIPRVRARSAPSQISQLILKARSASIMRGAPAVITPDSANRKLVAHIDRDGDLLEGGIQDEQIGEVILPGPVNAGLKFGSHPSIVPPDPVVGFESVPAAPDGIALVFDPVGTLRTPGVIRFADGAETNFFELEINLIGSMDVRKHLKSGDAPGGSPGYYEEGAGDKSWVWY